LRPAEARQAILVVLHREVVLILVILLDPDPLETLLEVEYPQPMEWVKVAWALETSARHRTHQVLVKALLNPWLRQE
jgi:hypothetical protein